MSEYKIPKGDYSVYLSYTYDYIKSLEKREGNIRSVYPTINSIPVRIKKGERCYEFITGELITVSSLAKYQSKGYGLSEDFQLVESDGTIFSLKGGGTTSVKLADFTGHGTTFILESNFDESLAYYRAAVPLKGNSATPVNYLLGYSYNIDDNSVRHFGYIPINFLDKKYAVFDDNNYLIIDCLEPTFFYDFRNIFDCITYSLGLLSGSLEQDECYFLRANDSTYKNLIGFKYSQLEKSIRTTLEFIEPRDHAELYKLNHQIHFPINVFNQLVSLQYSNKQLLEATKMICKSRALPDSVENTATLYVVLESLKNFLLKGQSSNKTLFKNSETAQEVKSALINIIEQLSDEIFIDRELIIDNIKYKLDSVPNNKTFLEVFNIMQIELNKDDKDCIKNRNRFLHGVHPYTKLNEKEQGKAILKNYLRLHFLVTSLIAKYAGFNGMVKNNLKYIDFLNKWGTIDEHFFRKI